MSMSKAQRLSKALGGTWSYDGMCGWWCDDDKRHVLRVSAGVDEFDNPLGPPQYWLYGDGIPRRTEEILFPPRAVIRLMGHALGVR